MNSANSDGIKDIRSGLRQRIENGEEWLVNAKKVEDWLAQSDETGLWNALGNYQFSNLGNDGGLGISLGSIELTLSLLGELRSCSDYLNAGMVIARANGGVVNPDQGVDLIQWMPWCKASNRRSLRKNLVHRLKSSGFFEEVDGGDLVLREVASRYQSVDEGSELSTGQAEVDLGGDLPEVEVVAVNGVGSEHTEEG